MSSEKERAKMLADMSEERLKGRMDAIYDIIGCISRNLKKMKESDSGFGIRFNTLQEIKSLCIDFFNEHASEYERRNENEKIIGK